jgi:hypothetical protein
VAADSKQIATDKAAAAAAAQAETAATLHKERGEHSLQLKALGVACKLCRSVGPFVVQVLL